MSAEGLVELVPFIDHARRELAEAGALRGQLHAAIVALEQGMPHIALEPLDRPA